MNDAIPIRADISPTLDVERELIDFCMSKISEYAKEHGEPGSIAFVILGADRDGAVTEAHSWTPKENRSQLQCCAVASAVLMKRALGI